MNTSVDLSSIEGYLLQAFAIALLGVATAAATRLTSWLGIKNSAAAQAQFEGAADAALEYGVARATDAIKAKGWDHVDVKDQVVATAAEYAVAKFPDVVKKAGIDISNPVAAANGLAGVLERRFPGVIASASASPATPAVPAVNK